MDLPKLSQHAGARGQRPGAALGLIFGEGVFDFEPGEGDHFAGTFAMGPGYALALEGESLPGDPPGFSIVGLGIAGTPTEGWRYDYRGVPGTSGRTASTRSQVSWG